MDGAEGLELIAEPRPGGLALLSPDVGYYTLAPLSGRVLTPRECAGWLVSLGRARPLIVPAGTSGVVRSERPERVHHPVGYRDFLLELAPLAGALEHGAREREPDPGQARGALVFRSPSAGRFWHRAAPGEPPLVAPGAVIEAGAALGLIEVMKTFAQVVYRPGASLPARARVVSVRAADGAEVEQGSELLELEPA